MIYVLFRLSPNCNSFATILKPQYNNMNAFIMTDTDEIIISFPGCDVVFTEQELEEGILDL